MSTLEIPKLLKRKLGDGKFAQAVLLNCARFSALFGGAIRGPFFPEYTDHGLGHVSGLLAAAEALIDGKSWSLITSEDAGVLILGALLHDIAMHTTPDGFVQLLGTPSAAIVSPLDQRQWPELFDDYFGEARRWDGQMLHNILGDRNTLPDEEEDLLQYIRRPVLDDPDSWSERHRKFIGEFIRRHHGRLAHEIAVNGLPAAEGATLQISDLPSEMIDLIGLVARSHSVPMRYAIQHMEQRYQQVHLCRNVHPVFLMALLRIGDYLQIQSDRAPSTLVKTQRIRSPLSQREWDVHRTVQDVLQDSRDAEALYIRCNAPDVKTYLAAARLVRGLQQELV